MFWLFMPWTCPKSWPRCRCSLQECGGGSISRAVAHIFRSQRQRSPAAPCAPYGGTPCWIPFSLAVPGFAFPNRFRGVRDLCFSVVEGPLCARSPIYFLIQRQRSPSRHLWRVMVERLVGFHFHRLFLASRPEIVSAGLVTFVLQWWKIHCARRCQYIS